MKLSIITTIYKAEKDLPRLLDSMMQQKSPDLEFFLIDNGSPDRCGEIAAEYAKRDSRFTLYTIKDNIGYIRARNEGIRVCTGDYIGFCDSDDYLEPGGYDMAIEKIYETDCDLYITSYRTHSGEYVIENSLPYDVGLYEDDDIKRNILPNAFGPYKNKRELHGFMWKEIFRRRIVKDICFDETLKPYEDQIFNLEAIARCNRVYIDDTPIYNYVVNPQSITASIKNSFDFVTEYNRIYHLYVEKKRLATDNVHLCALSTDAMESIYSMFLCESKVKSRTIYQSMALIKQTIDSSWVNDIVDCAVALTIRMKVVKIALRLKLYSPLLRLMKLASRI